MKKSMQSIGVPVGLAAPSLLASRFAMADLNAYKIDDTQSFANWTIRHVASKTSGTFSDITGKILMDSRNLTKSSVEAKVTC